MLSVDVTGVGIVEVVYGLRVGRETGWADLVLDRDRISRQHLEIRVDSGGYRVWDLGSRNGTTVNGQRLGIQGRALRVGDVIAVGTAVEMKVVGITAPPRAKPTLGATPMISLKVHLQQDRFLVEWAKGADIVRDTMPFQLGLALSMMILYRRDGLGPVPDEDMQAIVWRGRGTSPDTGNINRLLQRLRSWFRDRAQEEPEILRPKGAGTTTLNIPATCLQIQPDGWLYPYLEKS